MKGKLFTFVEGRGLVELDRDAYRNREPKGPYIQTDSMSALVNHADGRIYDSKSSFRRATKASGCEEVGSDSLVSTPSEPTYRERENLRHTINESIKEVMGE